VLIVGFSKRTVEPGSDLARGNQPIEAMADMEDENKHEAGELEERR
jgi:hypothetical protein